LEFLIRTRRLPFFRSRPSPPMVVVPVACAVTGAVLPFMPLADPLGFAALPATFFLILIGMVAAYLLLVEFAKSRFYAAQPHPRRGERSREQRHRRHLHRPVGHFTLHPANLPPWQPNHRR